MYGKPHLRSGELAKLAGISPDTLRHYERMKLLAIPLRSSGNYRLYPSDAVDRVRLIRHALAVGFSLPELAKILAVRDRGGAPCLQAKRLLEEKLQMMDEQIEDLGAMRNHLRSVLADWEDRLAHTPKGERAGLLETLVVPPHLLKPLNSEGKNKMKKTQRPYPKARHLTALVLFAALSVLPVRSVAQQSQAGPQSQMTPETMAQQRQMMKGQDATTTSEMGVMHELVMSHERIKRSVTKLPDGIRTVTESDDPQIAMLIKQHMVSMDRRVSAKSETGTPMESPALKTIIRNGDKVRTTVEMTAKGVVVVQKSTDSETVAALQEHALELSDLVERGMIAMQESMMKGGGRGMQDHAQHQADVNKRGDQVMGFDHDKTTHHFRLFRDGGAIEVQANDPKDSSSRDQVRQHLSQIAQLFASGDFNAPMLIHVQTPPGAPIMKRLKGKIQYRFEEIAGGGRVRITTKDSEARAGVHEFLRFQIEDHGTKDSGEIEKP